MIYHAGLRCATAEADIAGLRWDQFFEAVERTMKKIPDSSRRLSEHILRTLNKIRKPSTAGEITELLNRELDLEDLPFRQSRPPERSRFGQPTGQNSPTQQRGPGAPYNLR